MALHNIGTDHAAPGGAELPLTIPRIKLKLWFILAVVIIMIATVGGVSFKAKAEKAKADLKAQDVQLLVNDYSEQGLMLVSLNELTPREYLDYYRNAGSSEYDLNQAADGLKKFQESSLDVVPYLASFNDEDGNLIEFTLVFGTLGGKRIYE